MFNNKQWTMHQKYKAFCQLHERLINQYPNIKFPQSSFQFATKGVADLNAAHRGKGTGGGGAGMGTMIEDRRKILQQYLQDLALIPAIKESQHFKGFIGIQEHFPEFWDGSKTSAPSGLLNEGGKGIPPTAGSGGQFKLMNDLFTSKKQ